MKKCNSSSVGNDIMAIFMFDPRGTETPPICSCQGRFLNESLRIACDHPPPTPASIMRSIGEVHTNMNSMAKNMKDSLDNSALHLQEISLKVNLDFTAASSTTQALHYSSRVETAKLIPRSQVPSGSSAVRPGHVARDFYQCPSIFLDQLGHRPCAQLPNDVLRVEGR
eukprot:CAMPEP_0197641638 /NCGR_PEP_ID=MMETSP1338-20131121/15550_1 /TAXON_ID=43686 ORGANISM="Pelagodinium beii, Strain RCC1491" /NCGR_SAMPLE_ID=MMETSP1338 /ASSEMBLY_ACC=CAM_ASM_000754 /LENGTH=167 /DNA_ID=CAMNT_0043214657 /DNA_START=200 /DNA_END=705 /DNA_ORIENTATION=-